MGHGEVVDLSEGVVLLDEADAEAKQLLGEPVVAIDVDLQRERRPRLQSDVDEAEFRAKYRDGLCRLFTEGLLVLPEALRDPAAFAAWLAEQCRRDWVVYAKSPFGGPVQVLKYLARYTHRVAISNSRIVDVSDGRVTFGYKDYADEHRSKVMTLSGVEFLRRCVQHVLAKVFVKVRHYGLLANRDRDERLALCRRLLAIEALRLRILGATPPVRSEPVLVTPPPGFTRVCPFCGSGRIECRALPRERPATLDSS
ncbi:MAG TPA: transposase [Urbifossiella sp.]